MSFKSTTPVAAVINIPTPAEYSNGKITRIIINTPINPNRPPSASVEWVMGNMLSDGSFEIFASDEEEVQVPELLSIMTSPVITGETASQCIDRVIWNHLISIGRVPAGTVEV